MNQKILLAICAIGIIGTLGYLLLKKGDNFKDIALYEAAPHQKNEEEKKEKNLALKLRSATLAKPNTDVGDAIIVTYQESPQEPLFNAPCPISEKIQSEIIQKSLPISFKKEKNYRQWLSVVKSIEEPRSLIAINEKIRSLIVVLIKLEAPNVFHLFGTSEAGDLGEMTRMAICDEVALAHHRVKFGIDPALGQDFNEQQNIELSKKERIFLETMYRTCRMSASNSFRYAKKPFTRVSFLPSDQEWKLIKKALDIDERRPYEVVCTYKPKP